MPFIPVKSDITLVGVGGAANTATSAISASVLHNSNSLFGILQISNSNDLSSTGYDISASHVLSKRAPTCVVSATTISHSATNITYSATNVLHTASGLYKVSALNIELLSGDTSGNGGLKFYNGSTLLTSSLLYSNVQGYVRGLSGSQTGQIPVFDSTNGWTLVHSSSITAGYASTANTINTTITVPQGGTGRTSLTVNAILLGNGTSPVNFLTLPSSGSFVVSNGSAWTTISTGSIPFTVSTASYLKSTFSDNLNIGFASSSTSQSVDIKALTTNGAINISAQRDINFTSVLESINLNANNLLNLNADKSININSSYTLSSSAVIHVTGAPEQYNPESYNTPLWKISSSQASRTASIFAASEIGRTQLICNVGNNSIGIHLSGSFSSPAYVLGAYSSSQICYTANSQWIRLF